MDIKLSQGEIFNIKNSAGEIVLSVGSASTDTVQEKLVSGTNIKTVNGTSILGSGNLDTGNVFEAGTGGTNSVQQKGTGAAAGGHDSVAEGRHTLTKGVASHAEGMYTIASNPAEHAQGQYNVTRNNGIGKHTIFSQGIGTSDDARKNAIEIIDNGDVYIKGIGGYLGTEDALPTKGDLATVISNLSEAVTVATLAEIDALFDGGGGGGSGSGSL